MKIEGSAFRFGGGPGLPNRDRGGVPSRRLGELFTPSIVWTFEPGCGSGICEFSSTSSLTPSVCESCCLTLDECCMAKGGFDSGTVLIILELGTLVATSGLFAVRVLDLPSLSWSDSSTAGLSSLVTASGGLGFRGDLGGFAVIYGEVLC